MKLKIALAQMMVSLMAANVCAASASQEWWDIGAGQPPYVIPIERTAYANQAEGTPEKEAPTLPNELTIHKRVISRMDTFDLKAGNASFGTITEKFLSLTKSFTYVDAKDNCIAKARSRILSWATHIDVTDCSDHPIGMIKEKVLKSLFKVYTEYSILDAKGVEIATSEKIDWISTDMTIIRPDGRTIATLHRPWLNILSDNWTVKIADHATVDSRLIVIIAAYKSSVDKDRRREE